LEEQDLLENIVTDDEIWVFQYNPETKHRKFVSLYCLFHIHSLRLPTVAV